MRTLMDLFLNVVPVKIIKKLRNSEGMYSAKIAKDINATYSYTTRLVNFMNKYGLVTFKKRGRQKIITLTKKGKEVSKILVKLFPLLN